MKSTVAGAMSTVTLARRKPAASSWHCKGPKALRTFLTRLIAPSHMPLKMALHCVLAAYHTGRIGHFARPPRTARRT